MILVLELGSTEEQANEGQVLPLCLAEIERSRPYFVGLLGQRYGWVPGTIRPEVIEREAWLSEHLEGRTSVTELEILHGVLNDPDMASRAFFYFRDPKYAQSRGGDFDKTVAWFCVENPLEGPSQRTGAAKRCHCLLLHPLHC